MLFKLNTLEKLFIIILLWWYNGSTTWSLMKTLMSDFSDTPGLNS